MPKNIPIVSIPLGAGEMSPTYVLRIFRQFGFTDEEIESLINPRK